MSDHPHSAGIPAAQDRIEVIDRLSATRLSAIVERASEQGLVLRLEQAAHVPEGEAPLRWFDGATAWQAIARLEQIDESRVSCQVTPNSWVPTPVRRSQRAPADQSRLLVRIASSSALASGRRAHTVCLDVSATGCRVTWTGQPPRVGDTVDLSWELGGQLRGAVELGWIAARVARIITRRSGAQEVCFTFETRPTQAARIRSWHQAWLQRDRQGLNGDTAA